ncbi:MAG TPA: glycosyl hydrolase family 43, partial [Hymenobacter sp.]
TPTEPGTYEVKQILFASAEDREPNQGGLVDTPDGKWYFLTQTGRGGFPDGRDLHLLPVQWVDGWPIPGKMRPDGMGELQWSAEKPVKGFSITYPQGSDEFNTATIKPDWQWNYQPRADKWSLTERPGYLRLHAFKPIEPGKFFKTGNTLGQRYFWSDTLTAAVKIDISHMADGQEAGFAHFNGGKNYSTLGVYQSQGSRKLKYEEDGKAIEGITLPAGTKTIWLRSAMSGKHINTYAYSLDGKRFTSFGSNYLLKWGSYRGDYLGLYCFNKEQEQGYIDVDWFHYTMVNR